MAGRRGKSTLPRILVVGSANVDIVVPVRRLPRPGETVLGGDRRNYDGGKGANQAVAAARAGGRVRFVAMFGEDAAGRAYRKRLRAEGISGKGLLVSCRVPTGHALIVVDEAGRNQIAVSPGANSLLTPSRLKRHADLLNYGDVVLAQLEGSLATVSLAFRAAKRRGARTILNPAPARGELPPSLLRMADVIVPNEPEAALICGFSPAAPQKAADLPTLCRELCGRGPGMAVVTAGGRGAFFQAGTMGNGVGRAFPPPGIKTVDTIGAGDAFCGALAVALAEGADLPRAVRFAVAAASLSVRMRGAQAGLPRRAAILAAEKKVRLAKAGFG